jgi:hypothetical protein
LTKATAAGGGDSRELSWTPRISFAKCDGISYSMTDLGSNEIVVNDKPSLLTLLLLQESTSTILNLSEKSVEDHALVETILCSGDELAKLSVSWMIEGCLSSPKENIILGNLRCTML